MVECVRRTQTPETQMSIRNHCQSPSPKTENKCPVVYDTKINVHMESFLDAEHHWHTNGPLVT